VAMGIGAVAISPAEVVAILFGQLRLELPWEYSDRQETVLTAIRIPRVLATALVGAAWAGAGVAMQGLYRTPLADPALVGIGGGAALGAALGTAASGRMVVARMLLAGIALTAFFAALTALVVAASRTPELGSVAFWTLGSFAGVVGRDVVVAGFLVIPAILVLAWLGPRLDALALGEAEAGHLGIDVPRLTALTSIIFALLTAVAVAVAGVIAFVALMVPSLVRGWVGQSHRAVAIGSALLGATLLVIADVLARSLFSPIELSIGVITTIVGAPFFLWLLLRDRGLLAR